MAEGVEFALAKIETLLQQRRLEVLTLIADHGDDSRPVELGRTRVGQLSRMDALQSQAMAQETERRRQQELSRIEQALKRLADDEYGECLECGKRYKSSPEAKLPKLEKY